MRAKDWDLEFFMSDELDQRDEALEIDVREGWELAARKTKGHGKSPDRWRLQ